MPILYDSLTLLCCFLSLPVGALENGLARTPPLGWRSWNAYGGGVTQQKMEAVIVAMADRSRMVDGAPTSLHDLGYEFIGLDDGWQACGAGVNGSFHDAAGRPLIDTAKFPDMKLMVAAAHARGLKAGWYMNNCICSEHVFEGDAVEAVLTGSVRALHDLGFDGLKLDSCSQVEHGPRSMYNRCV